jgi:hypothetical protein
LDGNIIDETEAFEVNGEDMNGKKISLSLREAIGAAASNATSVPPPPVVVEDTVLKNKLEAQKNKALCFGFNEESDDDEELLSLPAAVAK